MAAFTWPLGKLETINSALSQTGDNLVAAADNGSVEWNACSPAYELALAYVSENHDWSWLTDVRTLQPSPTVPDDSQYDTAYPFPNDLVHLIWVRVNGVPAEWDLLNDQLVVKTKGAGSTVALTIKGVFSTNSDPSFGTPTVVLVLQMAVMSGIYRSLKKDVAEAGRMWAAAMQMLAQAKSRHDMQKPKRAAFNSRISAVRRNRKPWRQTPTGWSGTGTPN